MITLRVVVDQMVAPVPGGIGRYTEELTRALLQTAPANCEVEGLVSSSTADEYAAIETALPGLARLVKTSLARRELRAAWGLGVVASSGAGMIHAPGLLAPLHRHDRINDGTQIAVTVHDMLAWTHPQSLTPTTVGWTKSMLRRARKHADAIVVPSHAVAAQLQEVMDLGERVRVIGGAIGSGLILPASDVVQRRADALGLPTEYILTAGSLDPRKGLISVITALGLPGAPDVPLIVLGPDAWGELDVATVADEAGLAPGRVRTLSGLSDEDLAIVIARASLFVYPSLEEGFALPIIEAFHLGTPVILSDAPALVEAAGDAGLTVPRDDPKGYPERLKIAMNRVLGDTEFAGRLSVVGSDRSRAFSWRDSAERVWQLHADL
ncbi:glycosyltransferase family 1 protein [Cryobacterium melibiosiphilum]|uniref:Glycosyltransferase family 1 protein n=1 Tax=Cryobacterium melibiosiphilum TaxID=995039 RepID=A0A3A5ML18_9MICO|nr:glycosyltransferase family 1 protein [Cryobacterium melibiosiphilum]RJT87788.1 glycosyltransferase family 1 protein [Cryobacterium melibiosiphilum]